MRLFLSITQTGIKGKGTHTLSHRRDMEHDRFNCSDLCVSDISSDIPIPFTPSNTSDQFEFQEMDAENYPNVNIKLNTNGSKPLSSATSIQKRSIPNRMIARARRPVLFMTSDPETTRSRMQMVLIIQRIRMLEDTIALLRKQADIVPESLKQEIADSHNLEENFIWNNLIDSSFK